MRIPSAPRATGAHLTASVAAGVAVVLGLLAASGPTSAASSPGVPSASRPAGNSTLANARSARRSGRQHRRVRGLGPRGPLGNAGPRGPVGPIGPVGPSAAVIEQAPTINWQNGAWPGRERATFTVPGIGTGELVCRPDTQWVRIFPANQNADTVMWTARFQGNQVVVRKAEKSRYSGRDFFEGLNRYAGEPSSIGELDGIISSHGDRNLPGGATTAPTTFRLSWLWSFEDGNPRCYLAADFYSGG